MSAKLKNIYAPAPRTERGKPVHLGIGKIKKTTAKLIYCNGKQVIIRDVNNPLDTYMYEEHKADTSVARISPSGFYVASADSSGRILVWDVVGDEHIIKLEKASLGSIVDMSWSDDSKRIAVGGTGREKFAEVFFMDGGASVGDITGHSKTITSLDLKQTRPYRLITGSEDFNLGWFEGPPFKYKKTITEHTRFVNCVRFSPDGSKIISVGSDKKGVFLDGKEGTKIGELSATGAHSGSIYSAAWSSCGTKLATASVDKTVKLWNADGSLIKTYSCFGNDTNDAQLCVLWQDNVIASLALSGTIFLLEEGSDAPSKVLLGHNKIITSLVYDASNNKAYTADTSGYVIQWDPDTGATKTFSGAAHPSQIKQITVNNGNLITVSIDDTVKFSSVSSLAYGEGVALGGQPSSVSSSKDFTVVTTSAGLVVLQGNQIVSKVATSYQASAVAVSPDSTQVAVGGKDNKIYLYTLSGGNLKENGCLEGHRGEISALAYSHDGKYLAAGDGNREVKVWEGKEAKSTNWVFHTSRVQSVSWSPDNDHIVTGSVDSAILVWSVSNPDKRIHVKLAHLGGVRSVVFKDQTTLLSVGEDCAMKSWTLTY